MRTGYCKVTFSATAHLIREAQQNDNIVFLIKIAASFS